MACRNSDSLELSEYFNNDDSEGYRLAEFLQKKRGRVQSQNLLFVNNEPFRLSVDVQTEKAAEETNREEENKAGERSENNTINADSNEACTNGDVTTNKNKSYLASRRECANTTNVRSPPAVPTTNNSPLSRQSSPLRPSTALSPKFSAALRKSGGYSPSDYLRRYSLKRRSKLGRRTLLQEFENTVSDSAFAPDVCSTPLSQEASHCKETSKNDENVAPNSEGYKNTTIANENETDKLFTTMQCKDTELRQMLETILEKTLKTTEQFAGRDDENNSLAVKPAGEYIEKSPIKRVYTLEKGEKPGQVVLTPEVSPFVSPRSLDHSNIMRNKSVCKLRNKCSKSKLSSRSLLSNASVLPNNTTRASPNVTLPDVRLSGSLMEISPIGSHHVTHSRGSVANDNRSAMNITLLTPTNSSSLKKNAFSENVVTNQSHVTIRVESPRFIRSPQGSNQFNVKNNCSVASHGVRSPSVIASPDQCRISIISSRKTDNVLSNDGTIDEEVPNTQHVNISFPNVSNNESMMVPETQEASIEVQNCVRAQSKSNMVIIPVNQTFNTTLPQRLADSTEKRTEEAEYLKTPPKEKEPISEQQINDGTDDIKLTDIMTDDEEPAPKTILIQSMENNSQGPLNLAAGNSNTRSKRLRKKSLPRRRLQMEHSQIASTETETELAPLSLHHQMGQRKRSSRKKQIPLNKAPGTPLNGERFALELARMSNYEILDLRKRNSMGRVFAINGRKSSRAKQEIIKKQLQLGDEIEMELKRRNRELSRKESGEDGEDGESHIRSRDVSVQHVCVNEVVTKDQCLPAPDEFRDVTLQRDMEEYNSPLIDERSSDRVSFMTRSTQKQIRKESMPEVLQHYLNIPSRISQKKKSSIRMSKPRPLYTRGFSDSEDKTLDSSLEKNQADTNDAVKQITLPFVPSPPRSDLNHLSLYKAVSPPPPEEQSQHIDIASAVTNLPPPPQFESDSGIDTIDRNSPMQSPPEDPLDGKKNEDDIFKKPIAEPPKQRRGRKKKNKSMISVVSDDFKTTDAIAESADASKEHCTDSLSNSNLRRSKRGHVPLKTPQPLFQLLFQKVLGTHEKTREKRKLHVSTNASAANGSLSNSRKAEKKSTKKDSNFSGTERVPKDNAKILKVKKVKSSKTKSSKEMLLDNKQKDLSDVSLECGRLKLSNPPPIDHFNNIFDNLRNNSTDLTSDSAKDVPDKPIKEKKLRVRVARVKSLKPPPTTNTALTENNVERYDAHATSGEAASVTSSADTNSSNLALISWLKNITETETIPRTDDIFKEMRISSASSLGFTELQGVEYAFYDTEDKASLGYLRFKPRQIKPRKRAKKYHLHFVTLDGNFRITANDKERIVGPGDMVAIEKSVYYEIENLSDDTGILMVIKK
ncbi:uncharacterized protein LOC101895201 isoform X3 [Musca domestica]|uniref:Uncharacterized protein LOC101895201 isoform X3 n=1 Tax=Musca domestica TaxID=7370 RepID=A0A9J7D630_MUSDO|nr:uncharacterized protein LOC101895201 isoform X3 [Musca domestica]